MKDLFSGRLGRLNNHGGSPMFTTPNTIYVPPEYEVETDVPSVAEFVTCSLDGRLWVWKRSKRYYVAAFRWDKDTERLIFAGTTILSNINIIGRGVDWLLTDTMIIQASDDEPYILTANLFAENKTDFLYSILRSGIMAEKVSGFTSVVGAGVDSVTNDVWGIYANDNALKNYGYFTRSTLLQSLNKHYSMLPAVGDWNIIKNFLLRRLDDPLTETHNSMLNIRPLIPLEFTRYSNNSSFPSYGTGYDHDINLTYYDGQIWGRGFRHIGRCYILPATFSVNGTPEEFYLYISPDFICSPCLLSNNTNYVHYEGHTYRLFRSMLNKENAEQECQKLGGHLAHADTEDKINLLRRQVIFYFSDLCVRVAEGLLWGDINFIFEEVPYYTIPYFCEWDYIVSSYNDTKYDWLNMGILHTDSNLYGFLHKQTTSLNNGLCYSSDIPKVFTPAQNEWLQLADNGSIFFDALNHSGLLLNYEGAIFLNNNNTSYQCRGLKQWLAPAENLEAVSLDYVISSDDKATFATHIQQGFYREALAGKNLHSSVIDYSGKKLSLGEYAKNNKKVLQLNSINERCFTQPIPWENIYRQAVDFKLINTIDNLVVSGNRKTYQTHIDPPLENYFITPALPMLFYCSAPYIHIATVFNGIEDQARYGLRILGEWWPTGIYAPYRYFYEWGYGSIHDFHADLRYIVPNNGTFSASISNTIDFPYIFIVSKEYGNLGEGSIAYDTGHFSIYQGQIVFSGTKFSYTGEGHGLKIKMEKPVFFPFTVLPEEIRPYQKPDIITKEAKYISLVNFAIPTTKFSTNGNVFFHHGIPKGEYCPLYAQFKEPFSNTVFSYEITPLLDLHLQENSINNVNAREKEFISAIYDWPNWDTYDEATQSCSQVIHCVIITTVYENYDTGEFFDKSKIMLFRSELNSEIFDFHAEVERSKLS